MDIDRELPTTPEEGATCYEVEEPECFTNDAEFEDWARARARRYRSFPYYRGEEW